MRDQDYELLSQYIDGELDDLSARRLEKRLAAEPELRQVLQRLGDLDERVRQAMGGSDAVPEHIVAMLRPAGINVVAFPRQRGQRPAWQYAVAASLVAAAGLLLAPQWRDVTPNGATLASVLESTPSMPAGWEALADGRDIRPVLSFRDIDGNWCREYLLSTTEGSERGVACRENGGWEVRVAAAADIPGNSAEYRPAGAGDADVVADYLAERAGDVALSSSEEQALIDAHWNQ